MLYFAYGSNLHHFQMKRRCKDSVFLKKINLKDFRLTFRSKYRAADIEPKKNSIVPGGLFEISKSDEKKLDVYEDFPILYKKHYFYYYGKKVMTYTMVKKTPFRYPTERYLNIVKRGYKDCNHKFSSKTIIKDLTKSNMISISPLEMIVKNIKGQTKKFLAINEVSILRQSRQAASLSVNNGSNQIIKKLVSDGILVSTPAGSTAYNLSVHGPVLSLNSKKLSISPISPFRPRRWRGKIVSDKSKIIIKNLHPEKRPISAVADNLEVRNAKLIYVKIKKQIKFNLLYNNHRTLEKKIKIEKLRAETR